MADSNPAPPWHAAFPPPNPKTDVKHITPSELARRIGSGEAKDKSLIVVDLRRTDFENVAIRGALNLPAHSFYPTLSAILQVLSPFKTVVFHCNSCAPGGRGVRSAGWYQEAVEKAGLSEQTEAAVLEGGIKAWASEFGDDEELSVKL